MDSKYDETEGGMGMFCIRSSWQAFKVKSIARAVNNPEMLWVRILNDEIKAIMPSKKISDIYSFSKGDMEFLSKNIGPIYWKQAIMHFIEAYDNYLKQNPLRYLYSNFWEDNIYRHNNRKLPVNNVTKAIRDRIMFPYQLIKGFNGNIPIYFTIAELNFRYNYDASIIISPQLYIRITNAVNYMINTKLAMYDSFVHKAPLQSPLNSFINIQKKGASMWSKIIKRGNLKIKNIEDRQRKVAERYGIRIWNIDFSHLYNICSNIKYDNQIKFFYYLIIREGLHTNINS